MKTGKLVAGAPCLMYVNGEAIGSCRVLPNGSVEMPMKPKAGDRIAWLQPDEWDWDEWESQFDDDAWRCQLCGGEGVREYMDAPDEWGEDCPSEENHLIECRGCGEVERARCKAFATWLLEKYHERPAPSQPAT